jgi:DNA invertase Pin-like site-specific DNA recombinase
MEQSLDRQLDALKLAGAEEIIQERITGTKTDRPELNMLLGKLRKGDVILITDLTYKTKQKYKGFIIIEKCDGYFNIK